MTDLGLLFCHKGIPFPRHRPRKMQKAVGSFPNWSGTNIAARCTGHRSALHRPMEHAAQAVAPHCVFPPATERDGEGCYGGDAKARCGIFHSGLVCSGHSRPGAAMRGWGLPYLTMNLRPFCIYMPRTAFSTRRPCRSYTAPLLIVSLPLTWPMPVSRSVIEKPFTAASVFSMAR